MSESSIPENPPFDLPERILAFLEREGGRPSDAWSLRSLTGDASDRSYFRVVAETSDGPPARTFILMRLASPWVHGENVKDLPFVSVANHLSEKGIPVPEVHVDAADEGFLLLDDMGDTTLESFLATCSPEGRGRCYREAIEILVRMQKEASTPSSRPCVALTYAFDAETFFRELCFFLQHAVEGLWGHELREDERSRIEEQFMRLCREISGYTKVFTHRDYHARNLMVWNQGLGVLDFQDARMGPFTYDLASLLRDSYVDVRREEQESWLRYYRELCLAEAMPVPEEDTLWRLFVRTGIQRNLKAIGTFAFQTVVKGRDRYRESIPRTLESVRLGLAENPDLSPLKEMLERYARP